MQLGWFVLPIFEPAIRAEYFAQDLIITHGPKVSLEKDFVFVAIDDPSLKLDQLWPEDFEASSSLRSMKVWPWTRDVYAEAIDKIIDAGAKVVILDIILDIDRGNEAELKAVLDRRRDRVVLGANASDDTVNQSHQGISGATIRMPSPSLIENPDSDPRVGYVNFRPDRDGVVRSATYRQRLGGTGHADERAYDSLAAAALRQMGRTSLVPPEEKIELFRYADYSALPQISFYSLFMPADWKTTLKNGGLFRGKIVVIGPTASILHDIQSTPFGAMPGPKLHISALAAALYDTFYQKATQPVAALIVLLIAAITLLVTWKIRHPLLALASLLAIFLVYIAAAFAIANLADYLLPVARPAWVMLLAGIGCTAWNFARERRESGRMRSMLDRYVSRNLVREVLDNRDDFLSRLGGTRQPVTVFFSDVRGFTSFSEHADAGDIVEQLNEYLGEMVGAIFRHSGTVDKFMGDGIMAVWGNVVSEGVPTDARRAVQAALEMQSRIAALNDRWRERGLRSFTVGMGLHHGEAVFGNIGSAEKMEPTVIGDTVNLASRVEGLTKKYGVTICITQPLAELVADHFVFRSVDLVQVVGKSRPVEIFTVLGPKGFERPDWLKNYEGAIADFRARRFADAAAEFRLSLAAQPDDKLCRIYLSRCEAFLEQPPPEDWTGTEVATSK